ncbi:MAG: FMN-binding protein [Negativicutes bacterium]|nr:FMN-binding protein [Negativicutes bacterium]
MLKAKFVQLRGQFQAFGREEQALIVVGLIISLCIIGWAYGEIKFRTMVASRDYIALGAYIAVSDNSEAKKEKAVKAIVSFLPNTEIENFVEKELVASRWDQKSQKVFWLEMKERQLKLPSGLRLLAQKKAFPNTDIIDQYYKATYSPEELGKGFNMIISDLVGQNDVTGMQIFLRNADLIMTGLGETTARYQRIVIVASKWDQAVKDMENARVKIPKLKESIAQSQSNIDKDIDAIHSATMTSYAVRNAVPMPSDMSQLYARHMEVVDQTTRAMAKNLSQGNPLRMVDVYTDIAMRLGDPSLMADIGRRRENIRVNFGQLDTAQTELNSAQGQESRLPGAIDSAKKTILDNVVVSSPAATQTGQQNNWAGTWNRANVDKWHRAMLIISNVTNTNFQFDLSAINGSHTGKIAGIASINNNQAVYVQDPGIKIVFIPNGDILTVEATVPSNYFGMGVDVGGDFQQGAVEEKKLTLKDRGVFKDEAQEEVFRNLVGKDYDKFIDAFQLVGSGQDIDNWGAAVSTGAVRGLFTIKEGIIMTTSTGGIWAAVIDGNKVKYFSNRPNGKALPRTVDKWRERFNDKEVIYGP